MVWKRCDCSLIHTMRWIKKIIIFDIFFQENKFKKSSSIFSYILFIYLFFMVYLLTFPNNIGINIQTLLFVLSIEISYVLSFFNWYYCLNKSIFLIYNNLFITHMWYRYFIFIASFPTKTYVDKTTTR